MYKNGLYYGWIYKITNNINNKIYIGKTYQTINRRWSQHVTNSKLQQSHSVIDTAIAKYGPSSFSIELVEEFSEKTKDKLNTVLNNKEKEYIKKLNSLCKFNNYNITEGGGSVSDRCLIPIDQYNKDGVLLKEYESFVSATNDIGIPEHLYSNISQCCNGKRRSAYGYIWRYHGHPYDEFHTHIQHKENIPIDEYDQHGNLLNEYNDIYEISNTKNRRVRGSIYRVCRGERSRYNGKIYRFHGDVFDKYELPKQVIRNKQINKYTINNIFVETYDNTRNAAESLTMKENIIKADMEAIQMCAKNKRLTCKGFKWFYADDPNQPDKTKIIAV